MLHDYLRSSWRGVLHNKAATFINVGGLALGLSVFFALILYVRWEFSWDAHWDDADRIYMAAGRQESPGGDSPAIITFAPYVLGTSLQSRNPEAFDAYARSYAMGTTVVIGEAEHTNRNVYYAEAGLLNLLQLETLAGALPDTFADPRSIALHERAAEVLFGSESPIGKTLTLKGQQLASEAEYVVRAVFRVPEPSIFANMQMIAPLEPALMPVVNPGLDIWNDVAREGERPGQSVFRVTHYFKLREGMDKAALEADLRTLMDENRYEVYGDSKTRYVFQRVKDNYLTPDPFGNSNVQRLWLFAAIGVLVLLISGCNFVMLATLRSVDRLRELGIRKSVGGRPAQLMTQYLVDMLCLTIFAAGLAALLLEFGMPRLQEMLELPPAMDVMNWRNFGLCLLVVMAFTLVAGAYPAWLMARGKPARLFRNSGGGVVGQGNGLRKVLVGIQFAIVIVLLLASMVVQEQIRQTQERGRGYSLENILAIRMNSRDLMEGSGALVTEVSKLPGVQSAAIGGLQPNSITIGQPPLVRRLDDAGERIELPLEQASVGGGYFNTLSVPVVAGREFSNELDSPPPGTPARTEPAPSANVLLNVSAVEALGFATPELALEQLLQNEFTTQDGVKRNQQLRVIGVVADTQFSSIMIAPKPQIYYYSALNSFLAVKVAPDANFEKVRSSIETVWNSIMGAIRFNPMSPEQLQGNTLRRERFEARIIIGSTLLAMFIALLGLYGLVAATVVKRVKEIGVRKVMGADRKSIVLLLLWQFSKPVVVANLLAWPFGYWAVKQWLQRFPYQLDTALIVASALAASVLALLIAWLTVGFMATRAASAKPVLALRSE